MEERKLDIHEPDRILIARILTQLNHFQSLQLLDISNNYFRFRIPSVIFDALLDSVNKLPKLKQLAIEGFPLWDEDIFPLVQSIVRTSKRLQSLAVTRSVDAPRTKIIDKISFWKRISEIKEDRRLRTSIENCSNDEDESVATSTDSGALECTTSLSD